MRNSHFARLWALMKWGLEILENMPGKSCWLNIFVPNYFYTDLQSKPIIPESLFFLLNSMQMFYANSSVTCSVNVPTTQ